MTFKACCLLGVIACGGRVESTVADSGASDAGSSDAGSNVVVLHPDAGALPGESSCKVTITTRIPVATALHVATCSSVSYATNPPSGGDHWPIWSALKKYTRPVPREMYVHNLEHGTVVLAYRCAPACPDVVGALSAVFDKAVDPRCGVHPRVVLTPDAKLPTPIAAVGWGATYTATCIDPTSLQNFTNQAIGHGSEDLCDDGVDLDRGDPCETPGDAG